MPTNYGTDNSGFSINYEKADASSTETAPLFLDKEKAVGITWTISI